jgi:hypothetical protein
VNVETTSEPDTNVSNPSPPRAAERTSRRLTWTSVAVGVGVAVLQPELIPGLAIGAAVALAPRYLPRLRGPMRAAGRWLRREGGHAAQTARSATEPQSPDETRH